MFNETFLKGKKPYYWIALVGFIIYFRNLFFGFTYFDDNVLVLENLFFLKDISNFFRSFTMEVFHVLHSSAAYYRPILTISYMLDAQVSGESPFFYHLTSLIIHIINSCLVYILLQRLNFKKLTAFIFAVIFCVHPVLAQAVSWIPGRNDSLLALFIIPCFIFFLDFLEKGGGKNLFWHFFFLALSLFTKESAIFIPLLLIFYTSTLIRSKNFVKNIPVLFLGWFFIFLGWFFLRSIALQGNVVKYTFLDSAYAIFQHSPATLLYLGKVIFPFSLTVLPILPDSTLVYGIISLFIIVLSIIFSKEKNWRVVLFGLMWFLVFLLPAFIRPDTTYVADFLEHRIYVPIIGLFIIFGEVDFIKNLEISKTINKLLLTGVFLMFVVINFIHNTNFKARLTFWKNAVFHSPSHPLAHKNLGAMYYLDGNLDAALEEFEKTVAISPTEPMIHNNLGLIYFRKGDYKKAEEEYFEELSLYPNYDNAYMNLGLLYYQKGEKDKAEKMWLKTISINPDHKEALKSLAIYYSQDKKDIQKANNYYQEAVKRGVEF
jgi:hypothetical protein